MAIDAHHAQAGQGGCALVGGNRAFMGDTELVALEARGNVGVGLGVHVGIDTNADRCAQSHGLGHFAQHVEFCLALHVEAANADLQRLAHFCARLAYAGKDHLRRVAAGRNHALQFAGRNDIEAAAMAGEKLQDSERRVRFHGIADLHLAPSEPALVGTQGVQHGCLGIDVEGRAELPGQVGKAKALQLKRLVVVVQVGVAGQNGWVMDGWWKRNRLATRREPARRRG